MTTRRQQLPDCNQQEVEQRRLERGVDDVEHSKTLLKRAGKSHTAAYLRLRTREQTLDQDLEHRKLLVAAARAEQQESLAKVEGLVQKLDRNERDRQDLESKTEIYQTDTELDQILSVLKLGFVLLIQFLLIRFFAGLRIDPITFANQIFALPGTRTRTDTTETLCFHAHRRNPTMMLALEAACDRVNALRHVHDGRVMRFEVAWPSGRPDHAT